MHRANNRVNKPIYQDINYKFKIYNMNAGLFRQGNVGNRGCPVAVGTIRLSSSG